MLNFNTLSLLLTAIKSLRELQGFLLPYFTRKKLIPQTNQSLLSIFLSLKKERQLVEGGVRGRRALNRAPEDSMTPNKSLWPF